MEAQQLRLAKIDSAKSSEFIPNPPQYKSIKPENRFMINSSDLTQKRHQYGMNNSTTRIEQIPENDQVIFQIRQLYFAKLVGKSLKYKKVVLYENPFNH